MLEKYTQSGGSNTSLTTGTHKLPISAVDFDFQNVIREAVQQRVEIVDFIPKLPQCEFLKRSAALGQGRKIPAS